MILFGVGLHTFSTNERQLDYINPGNPVRETLSRVPQAVAKKEQMFTNIVHVSIFLFVTSKILPASYY